MTADNPNDFAYEVFEESKDPSVRRRYWETAIGLQQVDGLTPSDQLLGLAEKNIKGEMDLSETGSFIRRYYQEFDAGKTASGEKEDFLEADLVSQRIVEMLSTRTFAFMPEMLKVIHARLFQDLHTSIYLPGEYKEKALVKPERILNGDSVLYSDPTLIEKSLAFLFDKEAASSYSAAFSQDEIARFSRFIAGIWQVHPFVEGNTRTVAVFAELYLDYLGFDVTNNLFKEHAQYFRDALVRASYRNAKAGITQEFSYLENFFKRLLFETPHEFASEQLACKALFDNPELLRNINLQQG